MKTVSLKELSLSRQFPLLRPLRNECTVFPPILLLSPGGASSSRVRLRRPATVTLGGGRLGSSLGFDAVRRGPISHFLCPFSPPGGACLCFFSVCPTATPNGVVIMHLLYMRPFFAVYVSELYPNPAPITSRLLTIPSPPY